MAFSNFRNLTMLVSTTRTSTPAPLPQMASKSCPLEKTRPGYCNHEFQQPILSYGKLHRPTLPEYLMLPAIQQNIAHDEHIRQHFRLDAL